MSDVPEKNESATSPFAMRFPLLLWERLGELAVKQAAAAGARETESLNAMCNRQLAHWVRLLIDGTISLGPETPPDMLVSTKSYKGVTIRMPAGLHSQLNRARSTVSIQRTKNVSLNQLVAELLDLAWQDEMAALEK